MNGKQTIQDIQKEDILFRLTRDFFLDNEKYNKIMKLLFKKKNLTTLKLKMNYLCHLQT